jgi:hypothetical protein
VLTRDELKRQERESIVAALRQTCGKVSLPFLKEIGIALL